MKGRNEWPTYREFQRAGLKTLRDNITHTGGARHWAAQLGVPYVEHRPGYAPVWTQQRIREKLRNYLSGHRQWPSREQFERDGQKLLRDAVNRTGGPDRWASEFRLPRQNRLSGTRRGWPAAIVEARLKALIADRTVWPSPSEFRAAGLASMLTSIYAHEGRAYWAKRMGVKLELGSARRREGFWTEDRIREELRSFCAGQEVWPSEREFIAADRRRLYAAASRNGGIAHWAAELGLPRQRRRP